MSVDKIVEKQKQEIKQLRRLQAHLPALKANLGLSDESIKEWQADIHSKIAECLDLIRSHQNKK
jgi:hypothetical protein